MKRSIHFGNFRRIAANNMQLEYHDESKTLEVIADLNKLDFPASAIVVLRVIGPMLINRYELGIIGDSAIIEKQLNVDAWITNAQIQVRVIDQELICGSILGETPDLSTQIRGGDGEGMNFSLLPVIPGKIKTLYEIEYRSNGVRLIVNDSYDLKKVVSSSSFVLMVVPEVFRRILFQLLLVDQHRFDREDISDYKNKWLHFCTKFCGDVFPDHLDLSPESADQVSDWIDNVVDDFTVTLIGSSDLLSKVRW